MTMQLCHTVAASTYPATGLGSVLPFIHLTLHSSTYTFIHQVNICLASTTCQVYVGHWGCNNEKYHFSYPHGVYGLAEAGRMEVTKQ